jgi:hypothetical protein
VTVAAPLRRAHHPVTTGRADEITDICKLRLENGGTLIDTHVGDAVGRRRFLPIHKSRLNAGHDAHPESLNRAGSGIARLPRGGQCQLGAQRF